MAANGYKIDFRQDVQGLRALAVGLVILAHAEVGAFAGGFIGVDVFFVLSGYLITGLLIREKLATGRIRYGQFLARRLKRLLPAMLLVICATLILAALLLSKYEARMQTGAFAFAATWTSNLYFAFGSFDYFAELQTRDLFLHTWSLGVEEQFYIAWPWLVMLSLAAAARSSSATPSMKPMAYVLVLTLIVSLGLSLHWSVFEPLLGFYMMPSRGWQFALGALLFLIRDATGLARSVPGPVQMLLAAIGVALMIGSAMTLSPASSYPGYYALAPSAGAALFLLARSAASPLNRAFSQRGLVWLGDRSYSLYLWHWPVLVFGGAYSLTESVLGVVSLIAIAALAAHLSYRYVELPFWKGRFKKAAPRQTVAAATIVMMTAVGLGTALSAGVYGEPRVVGIDENYRPRIDMPRFYFDELGCDSWTASAELVPCTNGPQADRSLIIFADSIGAQWEPAIADLFEQPDWQVTVLTKSGCAIVDESFYDSRVGGDYIVCTEWRDHALDYIERREPDLVFVGSAHHYPLTETQWQDGSRRIFDRLASASDQVIVIPGTPALSFNGPSCVDEPRRFSARLGDSRHECEERQQDEDSNTVAAWLADAASEFKNVHVLSLNDIVCPEYRCAAQTTDGIVVFRDSRHLTARFVRAQADAIRARLQTLGALDALHANGPVAVRSQPAE